MTEKSQEQILLEHIAYCAEGMFDCEINNNLGDAKEWKRHLKKSLDEYYEHIYGGEE